MVEVLLRMEDILQRSHVSLAGLTARVDGLTARSDVLHEDMLALRADVTGIRNEVRSRSELRGSVEGIEERVKRLEDTVFKPAAE